ncbi:hypothetical protein [Brevundimonas sp. NPDC058933]|uniref:hypothetical protein n=1 Tax=Brevundimonas sp. NPDC058933 TaxID=3346673 RepID=UPI003BEF27B6
MEHYRLIPRYGDGMGHNPKYRFWTRENWAGYAPTIHDMVRRDWSLTLRCHVCRLEIAADPQKIIRERGRAYSPWGKSARCPRLHCHGRMTLEAYDPRSGFKIDV